MRREEGTETPRAVPAEATPRKAESDWIPAEWTGYRGWLRRDVREELDAALVPRLGGLGPPIPVSIPRRGRSFFRLKSGAGGLFVKRYRRSLGERLGPLLRREPMRGVREFEAARRVDDPAVATLLAFVERRRGIGGYESLLIYRAVPREAVGHEAYVALHGRTGRFRAAAAFGRVIARLHDRGIEHRELGAQNAFFDPAGAEPRIWLVDLESACTGPPLKLTASARDLGLAAVSFPELLPSERLWAFEAYREARMTLRAGRRELWQEIGANARRRLDASRRRAARSMNWWIRPEAREEIVARVWPRLHQLGTPIEAAGAEPGLSLHGMRGQTGRLRIERFATHWYGPRAAWAIIRRRAGGRDRFEAALRGEESAGEPLALATRHRPLASYKSLAIYRER
jgi:hypothetical protein